MQYIRNSAKFRGIPAKFYCKNTAKFRGIPCVFQKIPYSAGSKKSTSVDTLGEGKGQLLLLAVQAGISLTTEWVQYKDR
jgi:hypothetical protein